MTRLFGWALALSMIAGVAAFAAECTCCDPGTCTCCPHCNHAK